VRAILTEALKHKSADYVEIRVEESHITRIGYKGDQLETLGQSVVFGGNVRALCSGGWGFVSFNSLDDLHAKVDTAIAQARLIGEMRSEQSRLAAVPVVQDAVKLPLGADPSTVSLERKKQVLDEYNTIVLGYGRGVTSSVVRYFDKFSNLYFANSEGSYIEQQKADMGGVVVAIATRGSDTQQCMTGFGGSCGFGAALGQQQKVLEACEKAARLLDAPTVEAGEYTVVLDPVLAGVFAHEAFGHMSEADSVYENESLKQVMVLGKRLGSDILNIYDVGVLGCGRGNVVYDDEGVKTQKNYLIKDGILVGRLHSRETAGKLGEAPTGNARAMDYRFPPIVRMRNTCIEPGEACFEDMLRGIDKGVYAIKTYGGQTNGEMFTFSAGEAYMIRNGEIAELVRDVNLTGNVFRTLLDMDMISGDFGTLETSGGCGKYSQGPLPTSQWAPHVRIRNVVVGGRH